jgi:hypothetical protein
VTGDVLDIKGQQSVTFKLDGREFEHSFLVCSLPTHAAGLVGTDFMDQLGAVIDFERRKMSLTGIGIVPRACNVPLTGNRALPIFVESKVSHSHPLMKQVALGKGRQITGDLRPNITAHDTKTWLVRDTENVTIAPRCQKLLLEKRNLDVTYGSTDGERRNTQRLWLRHHGDRIPDTARSTG